MACAGDLLLYPVPAAGRHPRDAPAGGQAEVRGGGCSLRRPSACLIHRQRRAGLLPHGGQAPPPSRCPATCAAVCSSSSETSTSTPAGASPSPPSSCVCLGASWRQPCGPTWCARGGGSCSPIRGNGVGCRHGIRFHLPTAGATGLPACLQVYWLVGFSPSVRFLMFW